MDTIAVASWEEFEQQLKTIKDLVLDLKKSVLHVSPMLYRGQSNAEWSLATTLERYVQNRIAVDEYFRQIRIIQPQMETFAGLTWDFDLHAAEEWSQLLPAGTIPGYPYMVFLRHHGFPSPLLDWTESARIAAFFAFRNASPGTDAVAVFAFCEYVGSAKLTSSDRPAIHTYGPTIRSHPRHFLQQSSYSICSVFSEKTQYYARHEDAEGSAPGNQPTDQDFLWKFTIPVSERTKVLRHLSEYNLHAFSLFGSTESLAETLAVQRFLGL